MEQLTRRVDALEARAWRQEEILANYGAKLASLETSRDNERTRHSSTPAWIFGTISAAISIFALLFNLYLSGLRP